MMWAMRPVAALLKYDASKKTEPKKGGDLKMHNLIRKATALCLAAAVVASAPVSAFAAENNEATFLESPKPTPPAPTPVDTKDAEVKQEDLKDTGLNAAEVDTSKENGTATLKTVNITAGTKEVTLPGAVKVGDYTYPVSTVAQGTFAKDGCDDVTNITVPESVNHFNKKAFIGIDNLKVLNVTCTKSKDDLVANKYKDLGITFDKKAFNGVNTKKCKFKFDAKALGLTKKQAKKLAKALQKALKAAGYKGKVSVIRK